jgi:succinylglutamic semialdehyde dehydrogenase
MGGNNPLVVWDYEEVRAAVYMTIQSTYITSGQRCSAARRLIVNRAVAGEFIPFLQAAIKNIVVGGPFDKNPEPFMGPLIDKRATLQFLSDYEEIVLLGAKVLVSCTHIEKLGENFVSPGLIDVTGIEVEDKEIFGPLLQLIVVDSLEEAIKVANETQYGLCAGIFAKNRADYDLFRTSVRAGVINWNLPVTGAPVSVAFGGTGASGNHRPTGYLAVDYCSYACASSESSVLSIPEKQLPGLGELKRPSIQN